MRYYLVAALGRDDNKRLERFQRPLTRKGKNRKAPYIGIPMDTIEDPDLKKLEVQLKELLSPYRYFHVQVQGPYFNTPKFKVSGLTVTNFGYIRKLQRHLDEFLELSGFKVGGEAPEEEPFILSLSADRLPQNFDVNQGVFEEGQATGIFRVERIEVWKTLNAKRDSIALSIPLRNPEIL